MPNEIPRQLRGHCFRPGNPGGPGRPRSLQARDVLRALLDQELDEWGKLPACAAPLTAQTRILRAIVERAGKGEVAAINLVVKLGGLPPLVKKRNAYAKSLPGDEGADSNIPPPPSGGIDL